MPDGSFPIESKADLKNAIQAIGRAKNPAAAKAHIKRRARALGCADMIPEGWVGKSLDDAKAVLRESFLCSEDFLSTLALSEDQLEKFITACDALDRSGESVMKSEIDIGAGLDALDKTFDQFVEHIEGFAPEIATAMKRGAEPMATLKEQLQKAFDASTDADKDGLRKQLEAAVTALETSKAALETGLAKAEETNKTLTASKETITAEATLWKTRALKALSLEKAAKDYKNHPDNMMSEDETCKFLDMSEAERGEYMKAHPIEVMTQKRMEALPEPVRKQLEEGRVAAEMVAKMAGERETEAFAKRASELGQPDEFGKSLQVLAKGGTDEERTAAYDMVVKALEAAANQAKTAGLFKEFGTRRGAIGSAEGELLAKAEELREAVNKSGTGKPLSSDQAYSKVYTDPANRELVARFKEEKRRAA